MTGRYVRPAPLDRDANAGAPKTAGRTPATVTGRTTPTGTTPPRRGRVSDMVVSRACNAARTRATVLVVLEIVRCTRRYGNATPSRAGMAERLGVSERTVTRAVVALETSGYLTVVRDPPRRNRDGTYTRKRTSLYRLHLPRNTCSDRRDMAVTSNPLRGAIAPAPPALVPVDTDPDPPWHPRLAGMSWRDLVVPGGSDG